MIKRVSLIIAVLMCLTVSANAAWRQGVNTDWTVSSIAGAKAITGVSVMEGDGLKITSGTTTEWYYAVVSGVSNIFPLDDGGVTGFVLSDGGVSRFYVMGTQWDDGAGGMSPTVVQSAVSPTVLDKATDPYVVVEIDATAMAQIAAATASAAIHASGFAYDSQVTAFVEGKGYLTGVTDHSADHESGGAWEVNHDNLAGFEASEHVPEDTIHSKVTDWGTQFATNAELTAHTDANTVSGTTLATVIDQNHDWTGENEFSNARSGVSTVTVYVGRTLTSSESASTLLVIRTAIGGTPPTICVTGTSTFISGFDRYGSGATVWSPSTILYNSGSQLQSGNTLFWDSGTTGFEFQIISIGGNEYTIKHNAPSAGTLQSGGTPYFM